MNGIKLRFTLADFAKYNNMGIGSVRLKDGSSLKIISDPNSGLTHLFQVKRGRLLNACGVTGENANCKIANILGGLRKYVAEGEDLDRAYQRSFDIEV